jgi:hypothetical protein
LEQCPSLSSCLSLPLPHNGRRVPLTLDQRLSSNETDVARSFECILFLSFASDLVLQTSTHQFVSHHPGRSRYSQCPPIHRRVRPTRGRKPVSSASSCRSKDETHLSPIDQSRRLVVLVVRLLLNTSRSGSSSGRLLGLIALGNLAEVRDGIRSELAQDSGDELRELLVLSRTVDGVGVGSNGGVDCGQGTSVRERGWVGGTRLGEIRTLGSGEVEDVAVILEHVDLFHACTGRFPSAGARSEEHGWGCDEPWMGWTFSFLSAPWSFLSSPWVARGAMTLRRGVPLPPARGGREREKVRGRDEEGEDGTHLFGRQP